MSPDPAVSPGLDPLELMRLAVEVAGEAAELIAAGGRPVVTDTKSSLTDVVTAMDRAVEDLLVQRLLAARPQDGVLGEERGFTPPSTTASAITWVLDPIDGTVNYLYGRPDYAISVAAVTGDPQVPGAWEPVAGCVLQPATGHVWTAAAGSAGGPGGAWLDGAPLTMGTPPELSQALIATGFGYRAVRRSGQARVLAALLPQIRDIRRAGSTALDLCGLATGMADAYYERGVNAWDVAAAALVVTQAGGVFRGLGDAPPSSEFVLAAAEPLCSQLAAVLEGLEAATDPS